MTNERIFRVEEPCRFLVQIGVAENSQRFRMQDGDPVFELTTARRGDLLFSYRDKLFLKSPGQSVVAGCFATPRPSEDAASHRRNSARLLIDMTRNGRLRSTREQVIEDDPDLVIANLSCRKIVARCGPISCHAPEPTPFAARIFDAMNAVDATSRLALAHADIVIKENPYHPETVVRIIRRGPIDLDSQIVMSLATRDITLVDAGDAAVAGMIEESFGRGALGADAAASITRYPETSLVDVLDATVAVAEGLAERAIAVQRF